MTRCVRRGGGLASRRLPPGEIPACGAIRGASPG